MFCLICFDIVDDRTRARVVKALKAHGQRVQKSVFECTKLGEEKFLKLKNSLEDLIDSSEDTVRYYFLCKGCLEKVEFSRSVNVPMGGHTGLYEIEPQRHKEHKDIICF